jgi:hypothetical protein
VYVVVQHLDPTQKALLAELLQRTTTMPVREAEHSMRIEPDRVYVIPPNAELSVARGVLNLEVPVAPRGLRMPINVLFSSLARDQGELAVAVVFSGMGADGTLGLQAIKAVGGLTAVQQPDTAQFDAMPKSAIAAGCADIVASPVELPSRILAHLARFGALAPEAGSAEELEPETETETEAEASPAAPAQSSPDLAPMQTVFRLLRERTRHDFSLYKPSTLHAASSGAWRSMRLATPGGVRRLPPAQPPGSRAAVQGAADRRHQLLSRSRGLGAPGAEVAAGAAGAAHRGAHLRAWVSAARPARKPIHWPSCSPKRCNGLARRRSSACRSSPRT